MGYPPPPHSLPFRRKNSANRARQPNAGLAKSALKAVLVAFAVRRRPACEDENLREFKRYLTVAERTGTFRNQHSVLDAGAIAQVVDGNRPPHHPPSCITSRMFHPRAGDRTPSRRKASRSSNIVSKLCPNASPPSE